MAGVGFVSFDNAMSSRMAGMARMAKMVPVVMGLCFLAFAGAMGFGVAAAPSSSAQMPSDAPPLFMDWGGGSLLEVMETLPSGALQHLVNSDHHDAGVEDDSHRRHRRHNDNNSEDHALPDQALLQVQGRTKSAFTRARRMRSSQGVMSTATSTSTSSAVSATGVDTSRSGAGAGAASKAGEERRKQFEQMESQALARLARLESITLKTKEVTRQINAAKAQLASLEQSYKDAIDAETAEGKRRVLESQIAAKASRLASLMHTASTVAEDSEARAKEYLAYQHKALLFAARAFESFQSQRQVADWQLRQWMDKVKAAASRYKKAARDRLNASRESAAAQRDAVQQLRNVAGAAARLNAHLAQSLEEIVPEAITGDDQGATDAKHKHSQGIDLDFGTVEAYDNVTRALHAEMLSLRQVLNRNQEKIRSESLAFGALGGVNGAIEGEGAVATSIVNSAFDAATHGQLNSLVSHVRDMLATRALNRLSEGSGSGAPTTGLVAWGSSPEELSIHLKQLEEQRHRLASARRVLEAELARRAARKGSAGLYGSGGIAGGRGADGKGGGAGAGGVDALLGSNNGNCEYCMEERQLARLTDAIRRLQGELQECIDSPSEFKPDCRRSLEFQISRLRMEIAKRRAVLADEQVRLDRASTDVASSLSRCEAAESSGTGSGSGSGSGSGAGSGSSAAVCSKQQKRELSSQRRRIELELESRRQAEWEGLLRTQFSCLWKYRTSKAVEIVSAHLQIKNAERPSGASVKERKQRMVAVCHTLQNPSFKFAGNLRQCMCEDLEASQAILAKARQAAEERARNEAKMSAEQMAAQAAAAKAREAAEAQATENVKEALYEKLKSQPGFEKLVQDALKAKGGAPSSR